MKCLSISFISCLTGIQDFTTSSSTPTFHPLHRCARYSLRAMVTCAGSDAATAMPTAYVKHSGSWWAHGGGSTTTQITTTDTVLYDSQARLLFYEAQDEVEKKENSLCCSDGEHVTRL